MGLYRNIGGFVDNGRSVGLSLYSAPSITLLDAPTTSVLPSPFSDPAIYQEQQQASQDAYHIEMQARYDWLMSHAINDITAAGYYVYPNDGSIFKWQDPEHVTSTAYLPLYEIQRIENAAGTAGALLLHMQEPALAKDTAGYAGGSSGTFYESGGADPATQTVSDPIPQVQTLPPVTSDPGGNVVFTATPTTTTTATTPTAAQVTTTTTPLQTDFSTAVKNNIVPLAALAGLTAVAISGENFLGRRRKLAFVGGLGLLFYLMAKK